MLRLHLPEVMHALAHKPILVMPPTAIPFVCEPAHPERRALVNRLLPLMDRAQKYIFDSGSDQDEDTVAAVRLTATNMMEAGLFHQPHPVMWIEDPFDDDPTNEMRNYLLAIEQGTLIRIFFVQRFGVQRANIPAGIRAKNIPQFLLHNFHYTIDLANPEDRFLVEGIDHCDENYMQIAGEAVYSYKKMIVTLNIEKLELERVKVGKTKGHWNGDPRTKPYDHTIVRVPFETRPTRTANGEPSGDPAPRRRTMVAGYQWGKHTRPRDQQRWIKPFYRGDASVGTVVRDFYKVEGSRS